MISWSHWGMFEVGYYVHEVDPRNPWVAVARYIHPSDPDYCPVGSYGHGFD